MLDGDKSYEEVQGKKDKQKMLLGSMGRCNSID